MGATEHHVSGVHIVYQQRPPFFSSKMIDITVIHWIGINPMAVILLLLPETVFSCMSSCGGVVLTSQDARIVLSNTLDDRLMIAFQENLPYVRQKLFV